MAGGYGLSRMVSGAVEGIDKTQQRRDRETTRQRSDTQWQQGQDERDYQLQRRGITDTRQDEEYSRKEDSRERNDAVNKAMNALMNGNIGPANEVANKYSEDDISFDLQPNERGTYTFIMGYKDKKSEPKDVTIDDIGKTLIGFKSDDNPFVRQAAQKKLERETESKKGERKHDMAKLEKEYELKRGLKRTPDGKGGKADAAKSKANLAVNKELNDIAVQDYGSLFGDQWKFDTTQDKAMRSAQADLAGAYYFSSDDPNPSTNSASRSALQDMRKFLSAATIQADSELDEGAIEKYAYDNRIADIVEFHTDNAIKEMTPTPGESLQRGGAQESPKSKTGTEIPLDDIQLLKSSPTDQNKAYFDETYGEGTADKILTGEQIGEQSTAPAGVSRGTTEDGVSLIREASASTAKPKTEDKQKLARKKKDFSGQKARKEGRKSQKAHRQIAASEYKNEWQNMDDNEKTQWFAENAQALKAASPRSHRKANKEITAIRRKERFSKKGKADIQLKREERK